MTTVLAQGGWSVRLEAVFEKRLCTYVGTLETHGTRYAALCLWCVSVRVPVVVHSCASSVLSCVAHFCSARGSLRVTLTLPRSSSSPPKGCDTYSPQALTNSWAPAPRDPECRSPPWCGSRPHC